MFFKNKIKKNPDAARIYFTLRIEGDLKEEVEIIKVDGKRPVNFGYLRTQGIYLLPGKHRLQMKYFTVNLADAAPQAKVNSTVEYEVTVAAGQRYSLLFEEEATKFTLVDLPSPQQVGEEELLTYFDDEVVARRPLTAAGIKERFAMNGKTRD